MSFAALLWVLAQPPFGYWPCAMLALVPLLQLAQQRSTARSFLYGVVFFILKCLLIFHWFISVNVVKFWHILLLSGYLASFGGLWLAICSYTSRRGGLLWWAPAGWAILEWLQSNAGDLAYAWDHLVISQVGNTLLLQWAAWGGSGVVAMWVVTANLACWAAWQRCWRMAGSLALLVVAAHLIMLTWAAPRFDEVKAVRIGVIQPVFWRIPEQQQVSYRYPILRQMSGDAAQQGAELLIWPETAVPSSWQEPGLWLLLQQELKRTGVPLIAGVDTLLPPVGGQGPMQRQNQAALLLPQGVDPPHYAKRRLLPFAEYVPAWAQGWLLPRRQGETPGTTAAAWSLPAIGSIHPAICWENQFAYPDKVQGTKGLLVHLINDNWFGDSAAGAQHAAASRVRAVEIGLPALVVNNTGPSHWIDATGRIRGTLPGAQRGLAVWSVVPAGRDTPYRQMGAIPLVCFLLLGSLAAAWCRRNFPAHYQEL